jgi:mono/diheme cytochrome c family protein
MKKILVFSVFMLIIFSCAEKNNSKATAQGKKLFKQNCVLCHGIDGKLGLNNSKDLTASTMKKDERITIVKNGKGTMNAFGAILSEEDIKVVVDYTFTLK